MNYLCRVEPKSKQIARERAVILLRGRGISHLIKNGVSNGNAQRFLSPDSDARIHTLDQVAAALKVTPWQLIGGDSPGNAPETEPEPTTSDLVETLVKRLNLVRRDARPLISELLAALGKYPDSTIAATDLADALAEHSEPTLSPSESRAKPGARRELRP